MSRAADTFELVLYREDSFHWSLIYDETLRLTRDSSLSAEYHILKFGSDMEGSDINCLWWRHESDLPEPGEIFKKVNEGSLGSEAEEL